MHKNYRPFAPPSFAGGASKIVTYLTLASGHQLQHFGEFNTSILIEDSLVVQTIHSTDPKQHFAGIAIG